MKLKPKPGLTMFDLLKGLIMLIIVYCHSMSKWGGFEDTIFGRVVFSLSLPSLFIISGYWLNRRDIKTGIKSSVGALLRPYLIVNGIIVGIGLIHRALIHNLGEWLHSFLLPAIFVQSGDTRLGASWFLFALFVAWCLFYLVIQLPNEKWQFALACASGVLGGLLMPLRLPFQISQGLIAFFYLYAGFQIRKRKLLQARIPAWGYVILLAVWAAGVIFGSLNLAEYDTQYFMFSIPGGLCGAFLLIRLFLYLNSLDWKLLDAIRWVGRHSMWILCIHAVEANVFPWKILFRFVPRESFLGGNLYFLLRCILIFAVCQLMILFRQRRAERLRDG